MFAGAARSECSSRAGRRGGPPPAPAEDGTHAEQAVASGVRCQLCVLVLRVARGDWRTTYEQLAKD